MRTIGVISDTHGLLRSDAMAALEGSDLILHAGDVGDVHILEELEKIAPVHAVLGNTDWGELRHRLPRHALVDLGSEDGTIAGGHGGDGESEDAGGEGADSPGPVGPLAYVHHGDQPLELDPRAAGVALVVTGHTHRPLVERRGGALFLNPGSAGPRRFHLPATVARVKVRDDGSLEAEIVPLHPEV